MKHDETYIKHTNTYIKRVKHDEIREGSCFIVFSGCGVGGGSVQDCHPSKVSLIPGW